MNERIYKLKIQHYEKKILKSLSYLIDVEIISPLSKEYDELFSIFHGVKKQVINTYLFHDSHEVNTQTFLYKKEVAINDFKKSIIRTLNKEIDTYVYFTMSHHGVAFWVKSSRQSILNHIQRFFDDVDDYFFFLTEKNTVIQLYRNEYQWELLSNSEIARKD